MAVRQIQKRRNQSMNQCQHSCSPPPSTFLTALIAALETLPGVIAAR
jgi:hypothetical protein